MATPKRQGSEFRALVQWAAKLGFTCDLTNGKHLVFRRPNTRPVYASYSPSCYFARENTKGDLRRALREAEARQQQQGETQECP